VKDIKESRTFWIERGSFMWFARELKSQLEGFRAGGIEPFEVIEKSAYDSLQSKVSELEKEKLWRQTAEEKLNIEREANNKLQSSLESAREMRVKLETKLVSALETIEFYADENNWNGTGHNIVNSDVEVIAGKYKLAGMSFTSGGKRAREWMKLEKK